MKKIAFVFLIVGLTFFSCKKDRICECKNSYRTYDAGEIKMTKSKAKKHCKTLSTVDTECYLK